jgi:hypothetical protein
MPASTLHLTFETLADDDAERVAELGRALREAVLSADVESADFAESPAPPNTRSGIELDWTTLLVAVVSSGALTAAVTAVQAWVMRNQGRGVKLKLGGDELELTGLSRDQQDKAIKAWLDRQRGFNLP